MLTMIVEFRFPDRVAGEAGHVVELDMSTQTRPVVRLLAMGDDSPAKRGKEIIANNTRSKGNLLPQELILVRNHPNVEEFDRL